MGAPIEMSSRMPFSPRSRLSFVPEPCRCREEWFGAHLLQYSFSAILATSARCSANLRASQQSEPVPFGTFFVLPLDTPELRAPGVFVQRLHPYRLRPSRIPGYRSYRRCERETATYRLLTWLRRTGRWCW